MTAYGHDEGPALRAARGRIAEEGLQMPLLPEWVLMEDKLKQEAKARFRRAHMKGALALLGAAWGPLRVSPALLDWVTEAAFLEASWDLLGASSEETRMGELLIREVCGADEVQWTIDEAHDVLEVALG
jgi:hypothetical protein